MQLSDRLLELLMRTRITDLLLRITQLLKYLLSNLLIYAVRNNKIMLVKVGLFLSHYIFDINKIVDKKNNTLLHICTNPEMAKTLLNFGAKIDVQNVSGQTPVHKAVQRNIIDLLKVLLMHSNSQNAQSLLSKKDCYGNTALHNAVARNNINLVNILLMHGGNNPEIINSQNNARSTSLHEAVKLNAINILNLLLSQKGINLNLQDQNGDTPLHKIKSVEACNLLVAHKADIQIINNHGKTPDEALSNSPQRNILYALRNPPRPHYFTKFFVPGYETQYMIQMAQLVLCVILIQAAYAVIEYKRSTQVSHSL